MDWHDEAQKINEALHRLIGADPCATACTHHLKGTGTWSLSGVANVAARTTDPEISAEQWRSILPDETIWSPQPSRATLDAAESALLREFPDWKEQWPDLHARTVAAVVLRSGTYRMLV